MSPGTGCGGARTSEASKGPGNASGGGGAIRGEDVRTKEKVAEDPAPETTEGG